MSFPPERKDWIIIGISGVTCAGKTTLANKLSKAVIPVYIFNQDKYFYPDDSPHHVKCDESLDIDHNNYEVLTALDMAKMYSDILSTIQGDDKSLNRNLVIQKGQLQKKGVKFMVIEGFTLLNYEPIANLCDLSYYLTLDLPECENRRSLRVYDPPDVPFYFEKVVWPHYLIHRDEIAKNRSVKFLDGELPNIFDTVINDLLKLGCTTNLTV